VIRKVACDECGKEHGFCVYCFHPAIVLKIVVMRERQFHLVRCPTDGDAAALKNQHPKVSPVVLRKRSECCD
jgi:hypothetical protein